MSGRSVRSSHWGKVAIFITFASFFALLSTTSLSQHAATSTASRCGAPGGRPYYVVSIGRVTSTAVADNSARLAMYSFACAGSTVSETFWYWRQDKYFGHPTWTTVSDTGCETSSCHVYTSAGFEDHDAQYPKTLVGTYEVSDPSHVTITWNGQQQETWSISRAPTWSSIDFLSSNYRRSHGFGFGSSRGFSDFAPLATIKQLDRNYDQHEFENNAGRYSAERWTLAMSVHSLCSARCLRGVIPNSSPCPPAITSYMASLSDPTPRKNVWNYQCDVELATTCLTAGHLKPELQIIDDQGGFRGWVGVEADLYAQGYGHDVLGVFKAVDV